jgi:hypothetical protein
MVDKPSFYLVVVDSLGHELSRVLRHTSARVPVEGELITVDHAKRCRVSHVQHVSDPEASSDSFMVAEVIVFLEEFEAIPTGDRLHHRARRSPSKRSTHSEHGTLRMQDGGWEVITDPNVVRELMKVPPLPPEVASAPVTLRDGISLAELEADTVRDGIPLRLIRGDKDPK